MSRQLLLRFSRALCLVLAIRATCYASSSCGRHPRSSTASSKVRPEGGLWSTESEPAIKNQDKAGDDCQGYSKTVTTEAGTPRDAADSVREVTVPDIGDFSDVPVIKVHVAPGDVVTAEDTLITLESDKATMDIPSPSAGTVRELRVHPGDRVSPGTPILVLAVPDDERHINLEQRPDETVGKEEDIDEPPSKVVVYVLTLVGAVGSTGTTTALLLSAAQARYSLLSWPMAVLFMCLAVTISVLGVALSLHVQRKAYIGTALAAARELAELAELGRSAAMLNLLPRMQSYRKGLYRMGATREREILDKTIMMVIESSLVHQRQPPTAAAR